LLLYAAAFESDILANLIATERKNVFLDWCRQSELYLIEKFLEHNRDNELVSKGGSTLCICML
jgi:hypothetical protein